MDDKDIKIKLSLKQKTTLLVTYASKRIIEQIKIVSIVTIYLILFQKLVLRIGISEAVIIAFGIGSVILGLAFFMEGLFLGLMPLGELIGIKLPQKSKLAGVLIFSFILGMGATFAEPAVGVLKAAGAFVKPWNAPLLFLLLNKHSGFLVYAVGIGVGFAVLMGMLRFIYGWSLKKFLYITIIIVLSISLWAAFEPNIRYLISVAWDCGGITTGPVTVPLVLALGIGICRVVGKGDSSISGFGVVTLASLFPIITVLVLGIFFVNKVPKPVSESEFFEYNNQEKVLVLFKSRNEMIGYAMENTSFENQMKLFNKDRKLLRDFILKMNSDANFCKEVFKGSPAESFKKWVLKFGDPDEQTIVFGNQAEVKKVYKNYNLVNDNNVSIKLLFIQNLVASMRAIAPLIIFLLLVFFLIFRQKLPRPDEIILGVFFSIVGMFVFLIGIELGLSKLGNQVGSKLPCSFIEIKLLDEKRVIPNFDKGSVNIAVKNDGSKEEFFFAKFNDKITTIPYNASGYDEKNGNYSYVPTKGPLFGKEGSVIGFLLVIIFAFIMGYGATLAEPALNALGVTVEDLTVGTFKKTFLMQAVALGVGFGMAAGVIKIIFGVPLVWLLIPPYLICLVLTKISTEEFVNIAWDSAGVTTGPITVPLVLALGLGLGTQVNVVEGFGILAMASVYPILTVLSVGLYMNRRQKSLYSPSEEK